MGGCELRVVRGVEKKWWWFTRVFERGLVVVLGLPAVAELNKNEVEEELMLRVNEVYFGGKEPQTAGGLLTMLNDEFVGSCGVVVGWDRNGGVRVAVVGRVAVGVRKKNGQGWLFGTGVSWDVPVSAKGSLRPGEGLVIWGGEKQGGDDFIKVEWVYTGAVEGFEAGVRGEGKAGEADEGKTGAEEGGGWGRQTRLGGVPWRGVKGLLGTAVGWVFKPSFEAAAVGKGWRKSGAVGVIVLVIMGGVVGVGRYKRAEEARLASDEERIIVQMTEDFSKVKVLARFNGKEARRSLELLETKLDRLTMEQRKDPRIIQILKEKGEVGEEAAGVKRIVMSELVDLTLFRGDVGVVDADVRVAGGLWVLDGRGGRILSVSEKGAVEVVRAREELELGKAVTSSSEKIFVLGDLGVRECPAGKGGSCKLIIKSDGWKKAEKIKAWMNNLYVLDPEAGQIWKYTAGASGHWDVRAWVADDSQINVFGAKDLEIDGSIWVFGKSGLAKFVAGKGERFEIEDMPSQLGEEGGLEINREGEKGWVWDKSNARVVVWLKNGEYQEQWVSEVFSKASLVLADWRKRRIYTVAGQKVFRGDF